MGENIKYMEMNSNDKYAINFLKDFLKDLIQNFKQYQINSWGLIVLSKALFVVERFPNIDFSGYLGVRSRMDNISKHGQINSSLVRIFSNELIFGETWIGYNDSDRNPSFFPFIKIPSEGNDFLLECRLENWKISFFTLIEEEEEVDITFEDKIENSNIRW